MNLDHEAHIARYKLLHAELDELMADFIGDTGRFPSATSVTELAAWVYGQTINPAAGNSASTRHSAIQIEK